MTRLLVVTAATAERDAVVAGRMPATSVVEGFTVRRCITPAGLMDAVAGGVGPVASAVTTCRALRAGYDLVVSAGIAGGFPAVAVGGVAVADAVVHADLGAQTAEGFSSMAELGWGPVRFDLDRDLAAEFGRRTHAIRGAVLTVSTVTGSLSGAEMLRRTHPDAVAEAMEGIGAYHAAIGQGVAFAEIRTISNPVGPRHRDEWRVTEALTALTTAFDALLAAPLGLALAP